MGEHHPFEVIEGGRGQTPKRKRTSKSPVKRFWECRTCLVDIGVSTRTLMKTKMGAQEDATLRITGGHDMWVCVHCLARGKVTYSHS